MGLLGGFVQFQLLVKLHRKHHGSDSGRGFHQHIYHNNEGIMVTNREEFLEHKYYSSSAVHGEAAITLNPWLEDKAH